MREKLLIDAGPLIALFDKNDQFHKSAIQCIQRLDETPVTTWPVITEVSHMLDFHHKAQIGFLEWITIGGLEIYPLDKHDLPRMIELIENYNNVPMDVADASLLVASEHLGTTRILSIDSDFQIFRNRFRNMLVNEFEILQ